MRHHWPAAIPLTLLVTIGLFAFYYARQGTITAQPTLVGTAEGARRPLPFVNDLASDVTNPQHVFMAAEGGVFISRDGGRTWNAFNRGLKNLHVTSVAIDPFRQGVLLAGTRGGGIYRTADGGSSWQAVNDGLGEMRVVQVVFHPAQKDVVFALTEGGVFRSDDGGLRWSTYNQGLQDQTGLRSFLHLAVGRDAAAPLLLGTNVGTFRREEGASRWTAVGGDIRGRAATAVMAVPGSATLLAGTSDGGIFTSLDGGLTWRRTSDALAGNTVACLLPDPANPRVIYAAASPGSGIVRSEDGGVTWTPVDRTMSDWRRGRILVGVPGTGGTLYAVSGEKASFLYRSDDGGITWLKPVAAFPVLPDGTGS